MSNIILSFIQLFTIILICIYEYKNRSVSVFLWATLLIMFGFPHFLSIVYGNILYNDEVMIKASFFVISFNFIYFITKVFIILVSKKKLNYEAIKIINNKFSIYKANIITKQDKRLINLFFGLLVLCLLTIIIVSIKYFGSIFNSSWGNFYRLNKELGFSSPVRYATFLFFPSASVAMVFKNNNKKNMFLISLSIIIIFAILTGNRITILPALIALILTVVFNSKNQLSIRKILIFSTIGFLSIYIVYFLRLFRIYGSISNFLNIYDFKQINEQIFDMILNGDGELGLRKAFYHFIYIDNNFPNFNKGHTYLRLLFIAIPTSLSGGLKPPDFAITMGSAYSNNIYNTSYSMHPTLYGDCFANLWWFGIFLGIFWAIFSYLLDKFIDKRRYTIKIMLMVLFGSMYVIIGRGSVYNACFIAFISTIFIFIVDFISRIKIKLR